MRQFATSWRQRFAIKTRLFDNFHIGVSLEIVITTYMRQSHEYRTTLARTIGEFRPEFAWSSRTCRATVARYSRDTRTKLARWNCVICHVRPRQDVLANLARPSYDRRTTVVRRSCKCCTMVMRENDKSRTCKIPAMF